MAEGDKLTLKSSQGEIFEVEPEVACMSTLIKNMVDDSGIYLVKCMGFQDFFQTSNFAGRPFLSQLT